MKGSLQHHALACMTLVLLLTACATSSNTPASRTSIERATGQRGHPDSHLLDNALSLKPGIRVQRNGDTVIYRGRLTENGLEALRSAGDDTRVSTLLVESTGGEIVVGMEFGNWVIERQLDIVVDRACLSSCANYIFTAGRRKEILPGAVVAWHGSAKQPGLLDQLNQFVEEDIASQGLAPREQQAALKRALRANIEYLTAAIRKQDEFFFRIGVDEYVTRIGNDKYGVRGFFYLSVADMAAFGIGNVTAAEDYAEMETQALSERVGFPVTLVTLE